MTIDREHERLMQEALDGTASPADVERLKTWLATNELGRTRMRELEGLFFALERIPAAETPAGFKEGVIGALQSRAGGPALRRPRPRRWSWLGPRARLAYVFAAGIAAGVVAMGVGTGVFPPLAPGTGEGVSGSMMPTRAPSGSIVRSVVAGPASVAATAWRDGRVRRLTLRLAADAPAEVELTYDPAELSPGLVSHAPAVGEVQVATGRIVIRGRESGEFRLEFEGASSPAPIRLVLRANGVSAGTEVPAPGVKDSR